MDWNSDYVRILVILAGAIAYWLNQRRSAPAGKDEESLREREQDTSSGRDQHPVLIPDEIKRRILEQLGVPQEPVEPLPPPVPVVVAPPPVPKPVVTQTPRPPAEVISETRLRQSQRGRAVRLALRSPVSVRQAVILREVLGKPVGLP